MLSTKNYRNRCTIMSILNEIVCSDNKRNIITEIEKRLKYEKTIAAKELMVKFLKNYKY